MKGTADLGGDELLTRTIYPIEMAERRIALACDNREPIPDGLLESQLERAISRRVPLLEAQIRRAIGLTKHDISQMSAAIVMWERMGALPNLARAHAEHGLLTGDRRETDAALGQLTKLGDTRYVDRCAPLS